MQTITSAGGVGYSRDMLEQVAPDGTPLLLLRPTLLLTEEQSDFLSWDEIKNCIDLRLYIDGKMYPFVLHPMRISSNLMQVSMLRSGSDEGIYLPIEPGRQSVNLRFEWTLDFAQYGLEEARNNVEISHTQAVILAPAEADTAGTPNVQTTLASCGCTDLSVSTDLHHLKKRFGLTSARVDTLGEKVVISETLNASFLGNLKAAG